MISRILALGLVLISPLRAADGNPVYEGAFSGAADLDANGEVADDSHSHTTSTVSGLDAGADFTAGVLAVTRGGSGVGTSTGTGNNVLSASPTFTGTITAGTANLNGVVTVKDDSFRIHTTNSSTSPKTEWTQLGSVGWNAFLEVTSGDWELEVDSGETAINITRSGTTINSIAFPNGAFSHDGGGAIFNESGAASDFRIEGDVLSNLFFLDGSADRIGMGESAPEHRLEVNGAIQHGDEGLRPTCAVAHRGTVWHDFGATSVADTLAVCGKDASDVYAWKTMATF